MLFLAWTIKERSCDGQTKHGCVITNRENRILGIGYNGPPRGCDNDKIPNLRPEKYPWYIHSEVNAVSNCTHKPENAIAYVTGYCCFSCTCHLWQNGVDEIYEINRNSKMLENSKDELLKAELCEHVPLKIHRISPDFSFAQNLVSEARSLNFLENEFEKNGKKFRV